jgi:hypothetical protein
MPRVSRGFQGRCPEVGSGGEILTSSLVRELIAERGDIELRDVGEAEFKGLDGAIGAMLADALVSSSELYIAPLKAASVGEPRSAWRGAHFQPSMTRKSLAADVLALAADKLDMKVVRPAMIGGLAAECLWLLKPRQDGGVPINTDVVDNLAGVADCRRLDGGPALPRPSSFRCGSRGAVLQLHGLARPEDETSLHVLASGSQSPPLGPAGVLTRLASIAWSRWSLRMRQNLPIL